MSVCQTITYDNVTPDVLICTKKKLEATRIHVPPGNSGEIEGSGVKVNFEWDGKSNLKLIITDKPNTIRCGYLIGKITNFLLKCHWKKI